MISLWNSHKVATSIVSGFLVVIVAAVLLLTFLDWNRFRPALARAITAKTGRAAFIDGDLSVHLWSWTPTARVQGLRLMNPSWAERKVMLSVKQLTVGVSLGHLLRGQIVIPRLEVATPRVDLERDAKGRASWELGNPRGNPNGDHQPAKVPVVRSVVITDGSLRVDDAVRRLRFDGSFVVADQSGKDNASALQLHANGSLNEKPFSLEVGGGPMLDLTPSKPYDFTARIRAADIHLDTTVVVRKPFDLGQLDARFDISGRDLADVFYLTGLALPNTPPYRLSAAVTVDGTRYHADHIEGHLGGSDMHGSATVQTAGARPKLTARLESKSLNLADLEPTLGAVPDDTLAATQPTVRHGKAVRASQPPPPPAGTPAKTANTRLFSDAQLQVNRVRGMDADVTYRAASVKVPKIPMKDVDFHLRLDDGLLTLDPLSFELEQGRFSGEVRLDARAAEPDTSIDMRMRDIDLAEFKSAGSSAAPLSGTLTGRVQLHGSGDSMHRAASSAEGTVSFVVPHGGFNQAFAELTGIDVGKGVGLLLTKKDSQAAIRCSVIDFRGKDGVFGAKTFFIDTTDVLIKGRGSVNLGTERLDLELKGDPKHVRFTRLRSPITVGGTLADPSVGLDAKKLVGQGAVAVALGTVLTPVAAVIAFVDPGLAKDQDCTQALADEPAARQARAN